MDVIKDEVLSCFDSVDMKDYLRQNFTELSTYDIGNIIVGALRPLKFKLELMEKCLAQSQSFFDDVDDQKYFKKYVELYKQAFEDMQIKQEEKAVFLLNGYCYDDKEGYSWMVTRPFFCFEDALRYIKTEREDWDCSCEGTEDLVWFDIEKWSGATLVMTGKYVVSQYGEVWDYCRPNDYSHDFGEVNAFCLNLPVPFTAGDVINIDCRPFAPRKTAVVLSVGDNKDCCSVQCLYVKDDGKLGVGALKHTQFFNVCDTKVSALYRAERCRAGVAADDSLFVGIGTLIEEIAKKQHNTCTAYDEQLLQCVRELISCNK